MIQKAAQCLLALYLVRQGRLSGIIKAQRNQVAEPLMRTAGIMICLDLTQHPAQVGLAQQDHLVESFPDFPNVSLGISIALRRVGRALFLFIHLPTHLPCLQQGVKSQYLLKLRIWASPWR